ncbi:unnamed protein product [Ambrosiozyma monospora]|uniref:Unnamed protein product n=1 Tax=Ambrosiozyma monospora TaxID=43982 RepID=A0A9W6YSP3_AMBMO|nr:unnamed protein product [Ambrosiozyma monospora]
MTQQILLNSPSKKTQFNIQTFDHLDLIHSNPTLVDKFQYIINELEPSLILNIYSIVIINNHTFNSWIPELGQDALLDITFNHVLANCELKIYHQSFTLYHKPSLKMKVLCKPLQNNIANLSILQNFMVKEGGYVRKLILEEQPRESVNGILSNGCYHELSVNTLELLFQLPVQIYSKLTFLTIRDDDFHIRKMRLLVNGKRLPNLKSCVFDMSEPGFCCLENLKLISSLKTLENLLLVIRRPIRYLSAREKIAINQLLKMKHICLKVRFANHYKGTDNLLRGNVSGKVVPGWETNYAKLIPSIQQLSIDDYDQHKEWNANNLPQYPALEKLSLTYKDQLKITGSHLKSQSLKNLRIIMRSANQHNMALNFKLLHKLEKVTLVGLALTPQSLNSLPDSVKILKVVDALNVVNFKLPKMLQKFTWIDHQTGNSIPELYNLKTLDNLTHFTVNCSIMESYGKLSHQLPKSLVILDIVIRERFGTDCIDQLSFNVKHLEFNMCSQHTEWNLQFLPVGVSVMRIEKDVQLEINFHEDRTIKKNYRALGIVAIYSLFSTSGRASYVDLRAANIDLIKSINISVEPNRNVVLRLNDFPKCLNGISFLNSECDEEFEDGDEELMLEIEIPKVNGMMKCCGLYTKFSKYVKEIFSE